MACGYSWPRTTAALRSVLERGLRENGYVVDAVADGAWALRFLRTYDYEVVVLDWRMPAVSGLEVVRELRQRGSQVPVLMLTARDAPTDRVTGLDEGADDYLVKPFDFEELLARIRALAATVTGAPVAPLDRGRSRIQPGHPGSARRRNAARRSPAPSCRFSRSSCGGHPRSWNGAPWPSMSGPRRPMHWAPTPSTSTWLGCGESSGPGGPGSRRSGASVSGSFPT